MPNLTKRCFWYYAGVAELADALDLGSSVFMAWEFKSLRPHQTSGSDSVVECDLAKVDVASSNLVFRSKISTKRNSSTGLTKQLRAEVYVRLLYNVMAP